VRKVIYVRNQGVWDEVMRGAKGMKLSPSEYLLGLHHAGESDQNGGWFRGRDKYKIAHPNEVCDKCLKQNRRCKC
jgi:hypothetical protein